MKNKEIREKKFHTVLRVIKKEDEEEKEKKKFLRRIPQNKQTRGYLLYGNTWSVERGAGRSGRGAGGRRENGRGKEVKSWNSIQIDSRERKCIFFFFHTRREIPKIRGIWLLNHLTNFFVVTFGLGNKHPEVLRSSSSSSSSSPSKPFLRGPLFSIPLKGWKTFKCHLLCFSQVSRLFSYLVSLLPSPHPPPVFFFFYTQRIILFSVVKSFKFLSRTVCCFVWTRKTAKKIFRFPPPLPFPFSTSISCLHCHFWIIFGN